MLLGILVIISAITFIHLVDMHKEPVCNRTERECPDYIEVPDYAPDKAAKSGN